MTVRSLAFVLFAALSTLASADEVRVPRALTDFKPHPCAPTTLCSAAVDMQEAAAFYRSYFRNDLRESWIKAHQAEMQQALGPLCERSASCMAMPGNRSQFCNDSVLAAARESCSRYSGADDREQCGFYVEALTSAIDRVSLPAWRTAQECSKSTTPVFGAADRQPLVWVVPESFPSSYRGDITVYSSDAETNLPVDGRIDFSNQVIYSRSNPSGRTGTWYPFKGPLKLERSPRPDGHHDIVAPLMRIEFPQHPAVEYRLPIVVPTLDIKTGIDLSRLKRGTHKFTVEARDSVTGKPAEMRVMAGSTVLGDTNQPLTLTIRKGEKRPEIWLTSLFDAYSDVVLAPAAK